MGQESNFFKFVYNKYASLVCIYIITLVLKCNTGDMKNYLLSCVRLVDPNIHTTFGSFKQLVFFSNNPCPPLYRSMSCDARILS